MPESSLERMFSVLELVDEKGHVSGMDEMLAVLPLTRSTLYRYVRVLTDFGLLAPTGGGGYALGPRIIELDYNIRARDPLILASHPLMLELTQATPGIALLLRRYRDKVLCVHQVHGAVGFVSTYERGRARSLLRGAASRVILANMPTQKVSALYAADPAGFAEAGLGDTLRAVRAGLRAIRQRGWDSSQGQFKPGVTGIAAPIFSDGHVLGSLCLTVGRIGIAKAEEAEIAGRVTFCAQILSTGPAAKGRAGSPPPSPAAVDAPMAEPQREVRVRVYPA
ncbi:MAG TPA: IclR family transcriptional regulator C-terminal domain-containing protein [Caulobacteraceae bacterium]|jgi:DNA-binding IclR family transcriptional regulator|nr:IclR family transcriptional regulator C-terminal domain-containing protein [Caulobacteraceae bacterium]